MRLTAKSTYAIEAMYDLVVHSRGRPISVRTISRRVGISATFLCQIFQRIRRKGLIRSVRGANGGYILAKHPQAIKIRDIVFALEEPILSGDGEQEKHSLVRHLPANKQAIQKVWQRLKEQISEVLSNTTLADVCQR